MQGISFARSDTELKGAVRHLKVLKGIYTDAEVRFREQQDYVVKLLEAEGKKSATVQDIKVTRVTKKQNVYDEPGLAKALGATMWNKITNKRLAVNKLEEKVNAGDIDINVVSQYVTVAEAKPYIRISAALEGETDDD